MSSQNKIVLLIALLTVAAQLGTPLAMINRYSDILSTGKEYRFLVEPVDPAHPFKGRYVRLSFPIARGKLSDLESLPDAKEFTYSDTAYLMLGASEQGYAKISDILKDPPDSGDYIEATRLYISESKYSLKLPFEHYYAEESKAPKIESIVWGRNSDIPEITADIRIKDGFGVIHELYVGDTPVLEYLDKAN